MIDGLYKALDSTPTTSTLTSEPILVDGQYCVCLATYWSKYKAFGIDLGDPESVEWLQLYAKRNDETTPVSWYPNANAFAVYKSDDNSTWFHVENYVMGPEDIHPVSGSCGYWYLNFSESHAARYFKVLATGVSGAAWNSDGGSLKVGQVIASSSRKPQVQYITANRSSKVTFGQINETRSRLGMAERSSDACLEPIFSQQFILTAQSSAPVGRVIFPTQIALACQARTERPAGRVSVPCQIQLPGVAGSPGARFGPLQPTRLQPGVSIRSRTAWFGGHISMTGQMLTGLRSSLAHYDPLFAASMALWARSADAKVSGLIPTQMQFPLALTSFGWGVYHIHGRERLLYHLIEQGRLLLDGGLTVSGYQHLILSLAAGLENRQRLVLTLARECHQSRQAITQMLAGQSIATGRQRVRWDLMDHDLQIIDPLDWDILLDGISIKNRLIEPLTITCDQAGIHNQLTIESADRDLFQTAEPLQDQDSHALLVRLGTRELAFLLADRSGDQDRFTLTGLSPSIQLDHPYRTETSFNQDYEVLTFRQGQHEITAGQVITGSLSGASGLVIGISITSGSWIQGTAQGRLYLDDVNGDFVNEGLGTSLYADAAYTDGYLTTISLARPASEVAREFAGSFGVSWESSVPDWVLPIDAQLEGYPIDILAELVQSVGGIIRCRDNGSLLVRPRFPVRPIHLPNHAPVALYDRTVNLIQIDLKENTGTRYNAVEVNGYSEEIILPQFQFETPENKHFLPGDDLFARVYWTTEPPQKSLVSHWTTAGDVEYLGRHSEQVQDELVLLEQGRASVARPIWDLENIVWVGSKGWGVEWTRYSREISLIGASEDDMSSLFRIAKISYITRYDRYRVKNHNVPALLLALEIPSSSTVTVKVKYAAESEYPAEAIDAPLLTTIEAAVFRGQAELDRSSYHSQTVRLLAPYNPLVTDGVIVEINDDRLGLQGNFHVSQAQIRIQGPVILHHLECIRYLV